MENPKLALIPSGYISGNVYSILPTDGVGDFDFSRDSIATRVKKDGLIETVGNNVPRLDWLNSECPSLLLEPQRLNVVYPNTSLSGYSINNGVKSDNVVITPDGENNGSLVQSNGGGTCVIFKSFSTSTNTAYNMSVFLKKGNYNNIRLQEGFTNSQMVVDLSNGTEVSSANVTNKKIEDYGSGWYRVSFNYTSHSSTSQAQYSVYINGSTSAGNTYYTFGGQIEQGSYPTSHIKTTTGSATRLIDYASNSGNSSLFNNLEGTLFINAAVLGDDGAYRVISISDGSTSNRVLIQLGNNSNQIRADIISNGSTQASISSFSYDFTNFNKIALRYKQNDVALYVNGTQVGTDTNANTPVNLNTLNFTNGNLGSLFYFIAKLKELKYFDRALSNSELEILTTI